MEKRTQSYVEEAFKQILSKPNILDVIILNRIGNPIKTTMNNYEKSIKYAGYYDLLLQKTKLFLKKIDFDDELLTIRVRSKFNETIITPDEKITFIVIQNATDNVQNEPII